MFGTITYSAVAFTGAMPWSSHIVTNGFVCGVVSVEPPREAQVPLRVSRDDLEIDRRREPVADAFEHAPSHRGA